MDAFGAREEVIDAEDLYVSDEKGLVFAVTTPRTHGPVAITGRNEPRYAVGIDHGTDPPATVVAQIEAGNITWMDESPRLMPWLRDAVERPTVIKSSAPLAFDDDELDEEERGVWTPWSSTWDG